MNTDQELQAEGFKPEWNGMYFEDTEAMAERREEMESEEKVREAMECRAWLKKVGERDPEAIVAHLYPNWSSKQVVFTHPHIWHKNYEITNVDGVWFFENLEKNIPLSVYIYLLDGLQTTDRLIQQELG